MFYKFSSNQCKSINIFVWKDSVLGNYIREKRESSGEVANCDFASSTPNPDLCKWDNINETAFKWLPSTGMDSFWIGGPAKDKSDNNQGKRSKETPETETELFYLVFLTTFWAFLRGG